MKKQSAFLMSSIAWGDSWGEVEMSLGCGMAGTMCFLWRYLGQFPVIHG